MSRNARKSRGRGQRDATSTGQPELLGNHLMRDTSVANGGHVRDGIGLNAVEVVLRQVSRCDTAKPRSTRDVCIDNALNGIDICRDGRVSFGIEGAYHAIDV